MFAMMIWNLVQLFHSAPPNFASFHTDIPDTGNITAMHENSP